MVKYTFSAIKETFDFILKTLNIADVIIQISYIMYLSYRVYNKAGILPFNIALLVLTCAYFIYHLLMIREFYTKEQRKQKSAVKKCVKLAKYLINLCVIVIAVAQIYQNPATDSTAVLMTVVLIIGYIFSIMFEIIRTLVSNQVKLIMHSILYDIEEFRGGHKKLTAAATAFGIEIDKAPVVDNEKIRKRIRETNYKQENKTRRKEHFNIINKKSR